VILSCPDIKIAYIVLLLFVHILLLGTLSTPFFPYTTLFRSELGVPQSLITESVYARYISAMKDERVAASQVLPNPEFDLGDVNKKELVEKIRRALYFSKIMSYAQGFEQLRVASENYDWNLNYGDMAKIWREGCIIRAQFLQKITDAYEKNPE